jgi:hypothetical protein
MIDRSQVYLKSKVDMYSREPVLRLNARNLSSFLLFSILTSWSAMYVLANHARHFVIMGIAYGLILLLVGGFLLFIHTPVFLQRVLSSKALWLAAVYLLAVVDLIRFPKQLHALHPSTASFALTETAKQLAHAHDPYLVHLSGGAPVSPGPGWILLVAPLSLAGVVTLLTPICIALFYYLLQLRSRLGAGIFVCLVFAQPVLLSTGFEGHDIFAIPIVFASLCLLADRFSERNGTIALLGLLAGFYATSRIPIVILVLILGLGLYRRRARAGAIFLAISLPMACLLHGVFYLWTRRDGVFYQPLHLFRRAAGNGHSMEIVAVIGASIVALGIMAAMKGQPRGWIFAGGLFLIAAFVPQGGGELVRGHGDYKQWEGSFYVSFGLSLLAATLALSTTEPEMEDGLRTLNAEDEFQNASMAK